MARKKVSVKEMKSSDEFVTTMQQTAYFIGKHGKETAVVSFFVIALIVIALLVTTMIGHRSRKSAEELSKAVGTLEENSEKAAEKLEDLISKYPFSNAASVARFYRADLAVNGNDAAPEKQLTKVIKSEGNLLIKNTARFKLAKLYYGEERYDEAENVLNDIIESEGEAFPRDYVLLTMADVQRDAGKAGEARKTLEKLTEDYPESVYTSDARKKLESMGVDLGTDPQGTELPMGQELSF